MLRNLNKLLIDNWSIEKEIKICINTRMKQTRAR